MNNNLLITVLVSGFGLLNALITIFLTPRLTDEFSKKSYERDKLYEYTIELLDYLTRAVSYNDLNGVPTEIRMRCLKIHMLFDGGEAPREISDLMENIFQVFKQCKRSGRVLSDEDKDVIRMKVKLLRKEISFYLKNGLPSSTKKYEKNRGK